MVEVGASFRRTDPRQQSEQPSHPPDDHFATSTPYFRRIDRPAVIA